MGEKTEISTPEKKAIAFLTEKVARRVSEIYTEGVRYKIIFADEHGRFNGFPESTIASYEQSLYEHLDPQFFSVVRLSDIWQKYAITRQKIQAIFDEIGYRALDEVNALHTKQGWLKFGKKPLKEELIYRATQHNTASNPMIAATQYVIMRGNLERPAIASEFPNHLFYSYSSPNEAMLLPDLPKLYLWSTKAGRSSPPWFMQD